MNVGNWGRETGRTVKDSRHQTEITSRVRVNQTTINI